jgi:hypothetical protein
VEVVHVEIFFEALGEGFRDATNEEFVFAQAHRGDIGELIVFVDEAGVGVGSVTTAGEDIQDGDGVARGEPVGDGDGKGKRCVVTVGGEDEDLQGVAPTG